MARFIGNPTLYPAELRDLKCDSLSISGICDMKVRRSHRPSITQKIDLGTIY